jgi:hypothetical protein
MNAQSARNIFLEHALIGASKQLGDLAENVLNTLRVQCETREHEEQLYLRLSYRNQPIAAHEFIRDIVEEVICDQPLHEPALGILLLIDPWPHANWEHECWVAAINVVNNPRVEWYVKRQFPPEENESSQLVPFASYDNTRTLKWYHKAVTDSEETL